MTGRTVLVRKVKNTDFFYRNLRRRPVCKYAYIVTWRREIWSEVWTEITWFIYALVAYVYRNGIFIARKCRIS